MVTKKNILIWFSLFYLLVCAFLIYMDPLLQHKSWYWTLYIALALSVTIFIPSAAIISITRAMFTRDLKWSWKFLIAGLTVVIGVLSYYIYYLINREKDVMVPSYQFIAGDGYVDLDGTWDPAELPFKTTSKIVCRQYLGYCAETTVTIVNGNYIFPSIEFRKITKWSGDMVETEEADGRCWKERLVIDLKAKQATLQKRLDDPLSASCKGENHPLFQTLSEPDDYRRRLK